MAGNFQCPQGQICSKEYGTAVGPRNTNLYFRTSTAVSQVSGGTEVSGGSTTLYTWVPDTTSGLTFGTGQGSWKPAARSNDGKKWELLKDSNGIQVLGADAEKSLVSPNGNLNKNVAARTTKTLVDAGVKPDQAQKVIKSNTQTQPNAETSPQGAASLSQSDILASEDAQDGGIRMKYRQDLTYPINRDPKQDYIKFSMYRYSPKKVSAGSGAGGNDEFGERGESTILGAVTLPIQPSITDTNNVKWGEDEFNSIQQAGANLSIATMLGGTAGATEAAGQISQAVGAEAGTIKTQVVASLAAAAVGSNAKLFTRISGAIVNPNLELLFGGPTLRGFSFNFSMSAREEREAKEIREIIRFFKQGMSVKRAKTSLYLKSPNTFRISYIYGKTNDKHPWMNNIKECALTGCNVNYTPLGNYATYEDGAMTQYDLSLTFSELDPIYDDDYTKLDSDNDTYIGY